MMAKRIFKEKVVSIEAQIDDATAATQSSIWDYERTRKIVLCSPAAWSPREIEAMNSQIKNFEENFPRWIAELEALKAQAPDYSAPALKMPKTDEEIIAQYQSEEG